MKTLVLVASVFVVGAVAGAYTAWYLLATEKTGGA